MGIELTNNTSRCTIAVIDSYKRFLKLAGLQFSHGEAVEGVLKAYSKGNIEVLRFDITSEQMDINGALDAIATALTKVVNKVKQGERIDVVNLSQGVGGENEIRLLSIIAGKDINRENIRSNKQILRDLILNIDIHHSVIKERLSNSELKDLEGIRDYFGSLATVIRNIEELSALGVKVCVAAGNETKSGCNLITLANGITVVKSGNPDTGTVEEYSCDNALVDAAAIGTYKLARINMQNGENGFCVDGDGKIEIAGDEIKNFDYLDGPLPLKIILDRELEFAIGWGKDHPFVKDLLKRKLLPVNELLKLVSSDDLNPTLIENLQSNQIAAKYCLFGSEPGDVRFYNYDEVEKSFVECTDNIYILQGTSFATPRYIADKLTA